MIQKLTEKMIEYYTGDPKRIQHFIKVHAFSRYIGLREQLPEQEQFLLECAALVHDIGIKPAEAQFGECGGKLQERLGPPEAEKMLKELDFPAGDIARICYMVGHHHTYTGIDGRDLQILIEADFVVNLFEDGASMDAVRNACERIFRTESGKALLQTVFGIPAVKGVEFGAGFAAARLRGSEHNDAFRVQDGRIVTETNNCGGILGGISTGMPVVFRAAFKPTPSISRQQDSVSLSRMENTTLVIHGRHDPCIVPRAVPCVEAAAAIAVLDAWMGRKKELGYAF